MLKEAMTQVLQAKHSQKSGTNSIKPMSKSLVNTCRVCGSPAASHLHYGAISCYSCRAFFRRGIGRAYSCIDGTESCNIDHTTRRSCQKCRFEKCLRAGMMIGMVEHRSRKQSTSNSSSTSFGDEHQLIQDFEPLENPEALEQYLEDISSRPGTANPTSNKITISLNDLNNARREFDDWTLIASLPSTSGNAKRQQQPSDIDASPQSINISSMFIAEHNEVDQPGGLYSSPSSVSSSCYSPPQHVRLSHNPQYSSAGSPWSSSTASSVDAYTGSSDASSSSSSPFYYSSSVGAMAAGGGFNYAADISASASDSFLSAAGWGDGHGLSSTAADSGSSVTSTSNGGWEDVRGLTTAELDLYVGAGGSCENVASSSSTARKYEPETSAAGPASWSKGYNGFDSKDKMEAIGRDGATTSTFSRTGSMEWPVVAKKSVIKWCSSGSTNNLSKSRPEARERSSVRDWLRKGSRKLTSFPYEDDQPSEPKIKESICIEKLVDECFAEVKKEQDSLSPSS